jgi:phosphomevalonate kinase
MKKTELIGISGKQYAGKDCLADQLVAALPEFRKIPIALAIKEAYCKNIGLSMEEIEANKSLHRPGLIEMGNWGRAQDPDYWLKQVLADPGKKIISDLRLLHEFDLLKAQGAFLIRLEAERSVRSERGLLVSETDPTECGLDDVQDWDAVIHNNGTFDELKAAIQDLVARIP